MPYRASTVIVKAVRWDSALSATMSGSWSACSRAAGSAAQMTPLVWRTMKATAWGVTLAAEITRSPSFSRPGSSTTTTISPRAIASMACSILLTSSFLLMLDSSTTRASGYPVECKALLAGAPPAPSEGRATGPLSRIPSRLA